MDDSQLEEFLRKISQIESSGGKNKKHRRMTSGIHEGDAAMGEFGIMPKTSDEFIGRRKRRGEYGPDDALMQQMSPEERQQFLADNPRVETNLARDIAEHVLSRSGGDEEKAAYMWNMGHNKKASSIDDEMLAESPYVKKFRKLRQLLDNKKTMVAEEPEVNNILP